MGRGKAKTKKGKKMTSFTTNFVQYMSASALGMGYKAVLVDEDPSNASSGSAECAMSISLHPEGAIHVWSTKKWETLNVQSF